MKNGVKTIPFCLILLFSVVSVYAAPTVKSAKTPAPTAKIVRLNCPKCKDIPRTDTAPIQCDICSDGTGILKPVIRGAFGYKLGQKLKLPKDKIGKEGEMKVTPKKKDQIFGITNYSVYYDINGCVYALYMNFESEDKKIYAETFTESYVEKYKDDIIVKKYPIVRSIEINSRSEEIKIDYQTEGRIFIKSKPHAYYAQKSKEEAIKSKIKIKVD